MMLATEIITGQREKIDSKRLDRIIRSEYSTDTVAATNNSITDNYSDMLKECVPEDKLDEMDERINEYVEAVSHAVFEQGFIRGVAADRGGAV